VVGEFERDNFQQILLFLILDNGLLTGRVGMMGEFSPLEPGPKDTSPLIDLGDVSLDDVARMDDSALVHSLNRILGDATSPDAVILASFSASV